MTGSGRDGPNGPPGFCAALDTNLTLYISFYIYMWVWNKNIVKRLYQMNIRENTSYTVKELDVDQLYIMMGLVSSH